MPVTLTIKQVPDRIADKIRSRAAASHRSMQGEMMAILEQAVLQGASEARQPEPPAYAVKRISKRVSGKIPVHGRRLTLSELWARSRRLGPGAQSESTGIVRALRDERYGR